MAKGDSVLNRPAGQEVYQGKKHSVAKWLTDDGLEILRCWARDFTLQEIAGKMNIRYDLFLKWRKMYPEIEEALSVGREQVDYQVENALLKSALGYTTHKSKIVMELDKKTGELVTTRRESTTEEMPPNVTAIMGWLNNRRPDRWKRNRDYDSASKEDRDINITIVNHGADGKQSSAKLATQSDDEDWDAQEEEWQADVQNGRQPKDRVTKQTAKSINTAVKSGGKKPVVSVSEEDDEWAALEEEEEW